MPKGNQICKVVFRCLPSSKNRRSRELWDWLPSSMALSIDWMFQALDSFWLAPTFWGLQCFSGKCTCTPSAMAPAIQLQCCPGLSCGAESSWVDPIGRSRVCGSDGGLLACGDWECGCASATVSKLLNRLKLCNLHARKLFSTMRKW